MLYVDICTLISVTYTVDIQVIDQTSDNFKNTHILKNQCCEFLVTQEDYKFPVVKVDLSDKYRQVSKLNCLV